MCFWKGMVRASFAVLSLVSISAAQVPNYISGNWYPAGGPSAYRSDGGNIGDHTIALYAFHQQGTANISALAARVRFAYSGESFALAIYANDPDSNFPTGTPVARSSVIDASHPPSLTNGGVLTGDILGATFRTLADEHIYWAAVMVSDGNMEFQAQSVVSNYSAYLVGSTDPRALFGSGSAASFSLLTPFTTFGMWPHLTNARFIPTQTARTAALAYKVF
jgi:hypothetical protein